MVASTAVPWSVNSLNESFLRNLLPEQALDGFFRPFTRIVHRAKARSVNQGMCLGCETFRRTGIGPSRSKRMTSGRDARQAGETHDLGTVGPLKPPSNPAGVFARSLEACQGQYFLGPAAVSTAIHSRHDLEAIIFRPRNHGRRLFQGGVIL
jgi:hypothetical protein